MIIGISPTPNTKEIFKRRSLQGEELCSRSFKMKTRKIKEEKYCLTATSFRYLGNSSSSRA